MPRVARYCLICGDLHGHTGVSSGRVVRGEGGFRMVDFTVCLTRSVDSSGDPVVRLGAPVLDDYLRFVQVRARPNTLLAHAMA